jgi:cell division protein FtsL
MKIDIGTLITIITLSIAIGSTYYSVSDGIDTLEAKVSKLEKKVRKCKCRVNSPSRQ